MTIPAEIVWAWVGYIFVQLIASIWWASAMQSTVKQAVRTLGKIEEDIEKVQGAYLKKEEHIRELALADQQHLAMWREIDKLREWQATHNK